MRLHFYDPTTTLNRQSKVKFMESNKRKKHQDIYSTDHSEKDIYTPHYSNNIAQERKRDRRRQKRNKFCTWPFCLITLCRSCLYYHK